LGIRELVKPLLRTRANDRESSAADDEVTPRPGSRSRALMRRVLQVAGLLVGLALVVVAVEQLAYYNRVLPGVEVEGADVAGATDGQARAQLEDLAARLEHERIVATVGDQRLSATPRELGFEVDVDATLRAARDAGREDLNPLELFGTTFTRHATGDEVALRVRWEEEELTRVLGNWEVLAVSGFVPGDVKFEGSNVVTEFPAAGTTIDRDAARRLVEEQLRSADRTPLELPTVPYEPALSDADVQRVADHATAVLSAPFEFVSGFTSFVATPDQVAAALITTRAADGSDLALGIDPARLSVALGPGAHAFDAAPVDATFVINPDNIPAVVPSQDGRTLDVAALVPSMLAQQRRIEAPFAPVVPARNTAWAESLGIKELVSSFTTEHPCCASRVTNIHRAADLINGIIVEPGQVFSLNEAVGPRTVGRGFLEAPVFYQMFTTDVGGGVSQLSTTVYNAAWWGGFEIVEHQPHSIWISRYPAGREATLNYGTIDNRFRNNSQHAILIHTSYTGTSITVSIYGDKEGKVVREENRAITSGRQAAGAAFTVVYDRVIERPGQPPVRETYRWRYRDAP
jgi:vancomycin resistance protein YoaR